MSFTSILQILKLGDKRSGMSQKTGKPWEMQEAECLLLDDTGAVQSVGVLMLSKAMREAGIQPGTYTAAFALQPDLQTRRIGAVLTSLTPVQLGKPAPAAKQSNGG